MHESEAERIYKTFFGTKVPESIQKQFNTISGKIDSLFNSEEIRKYNKSILQIHDLEALELAARYFKKLPILTLKFKVMLYLAETLPVNYSKFINEKDGPFIGCLLLFYSLLRSAFKFMKGTCLLIFNRI
jgi:hypothetical protein